MNLIEVFKNANVVIGLIVLVFTTVSGLVYWLHKRMHAVAITANSQNVRSASESNQRLSELEDELNGLRSDVRHLTGRTSRIEQNIETVARAQDVHLINTTLAEMRGSFSAQMLAISGQVDTLYKAALRASQKDN